MRFLATINRGFRFVTGYQLEIHVIFEQICDAFTLALTYRCLLWNYFTKNTLEGCFDPSEDSGPSRKGTLGLYQIAKVLYNTAYHAFPG